MLTSRQVLAASFAETGHRLAANLAKSLGHPLSAVHRPNTVSPDCMAQEHC